MKKYLIDVVIVLFVLFISFASYYIWGFYINFNSTVFSFTSNDSEKIYVHGDEFTVRGVNIGAGIPGHFATDYAIDKEYAYYGDKIKLEDYSNLKI
mgnify:CR=1 FL=1